MKNDEHPHVIRLSEQKQNLDKGRVGALRLLPRTPDTRSASVDLSLVKKIAREEYITRAQAIHREPSRAHVERTHREVFRRSFSVRMAEGLAGKFAALMLIPTMLIYPILPAYAAEDAGSTPPAKTSTVTETPVPEATSETGSIAADIKIVAQAITDVINPPAKKIADDTASSSSSQNAPDASSTDPATLLPPTDGDASSTDATSTLPDLPPAGHASSTDATSTPPADGGKKATTTPDVITASSTDSVASSTDEVATTTEEIAKDVPKALTNDEIIAQKLAEKEEAMRTSIRKDVENEFTKGCVTLDTVGYYCLKDRDVNVAGALAPSTAISAVASQPDEKGGVYKQIVVTKGIETSQLTHDEWDNTFPSTDLTGSSVVWQGNVKGRWQIFFADASGTGTPQVIQLTHSNESNFNPRVDGSDVVWQGWVDGNWEIFLAEHLTPENFIASTSIPKENQLLGIDSEWKVTRITQNTTHDMFPSVAGELITWQSFQDSAWNIYVYSMKTHATSQLSHSKDKSEKPRFAITWDERSAEGAARMVGYDIASGKALDLTSEARQVNDAKPYSKQPEAPISQPNQAALPVATSTASSTSVKGDSDGSSGNDLGI